jgi:hypothetical protein
MADTVRRKTGGRKKGTPNKANAKREAEIAASGLTPLDYMLKVMRDPNEDKDRRLEAAGKAAQYVHPKLAAITHKGDAEKPVVIADMDAERFEAIARKLAQEI